MDRHWARSLACRSTSSWPLALVLVPLGLSSLGTSCLLELDGAIACGDGYVDRDAGEECDPGDPASFELGCLGTSREDGVAACDPDTCTIIATIAQCAICGDGHVDREAGEECDGDNLAGEACDGGVGLLQCSNDCTFDKSGCETCGNGVLDEDLGEECDPNMPGGVAVVRACEELPPLTNRAYAGGIYRECRDDCLFSRLGCNYCGNLQLDGQLPVDLDGNTTPAEVCDTWVFDEAYIEDKLPNSICYQEPDLRPVVRCDASCTDVQPAESEQLCCVKKDRPCPLPGSTRKCCHELENPGSVDPCVDKIVVGQTIEHVCR